MFATPGLRNALKRLASNLSDASGLLDEKNRLVMQLCSTDNQEALEALHTLWVRGWLTNGTLHKAHLEGANLKEAYLQDVDLREANLQKASLSRANLYQANLKGTDLRGANLNAAILCRSNLQEADLRGAFLLEADLRQATMRGANLDGARLGSVNLHGALVANEQLARAITLCGAILPDGSPYDGRFNLPGDVELARFLEIDLGDAAAMAFFYNVLIEDYECGQEWAVKFTGHNVNPGPSAPVEQLPS